MKPSALVQLAPDADAAAKLLATLERFNQAANWLAGLAFDHRCARQFDLHKLAYRQLRERFGLPAQMAVRCLAQVCEAYKRDTGIRPTFRDCAAMPYDLRLLSYKPGEHASLATLQGRVLVPMIVGEYQRDRLALPRKQADLIRRKDGRWFLSIVVEIAEPEPLPATDFLGVDLGIANIAADSDGTIHSGKPVERVRRKHNLQRKRLGRKNTKGAKKKIRRVGQKEARFRKHQNHCISKAIVTAAKGTGRGIAVEDLGGIRDRLPAWGRDARNRLSGWSFGQLVAFLEYKARLAGIPLVRVDPAYSSQTCSGCGHCEKANRTSQSEFHCVSCGHHEHADVNAARNHRALAVSKPAIGLGSQGPSPAA